MSDIISCPSQDQWYKSFTVNNIMYQCIITQCIRRDDCQQYTKICASELRL